MKAHILIQGILTVIVIIVAVAGTLTYASMYHDIKALKAQVDSIQGDLSSQDARIDGAVQQAQTSVDEKISTFEQSQDDLVASVQQQGDDLEALNERVVDHADLIASVLPSVVQVGNNDGGAGTGFVVGGFVVTNVHVVGTQSSVTVVDSGGEEHPATVAFRDDAHDIALLRPQGFVGPSLELSTDYRTGQHIYVVGNPEGMGISVTEGVISAADVDDNGSPAIQISAEINHGNSGGPVIDEHGHVIGVVRKRIFAYEGISYAVPAEEVKPVLKAAGYIQP